MNYESGSRETTQAAARENTMIATLQCRHCLTDWETPAEVVTYPLDIGSDETGTFMNFENTTCPECGGESYWDITG